jgi:trans-aconitate methyltransferase
VSGYAATNGAAYERSMGRWSRKLAEAMLDALALTPGLAVLDAGCGTGALSDALAVRDPSARITGIDISPAFLEAARARVPSGDFRQGDLTALALPDATFDAALSLLVLQFVPAIGSVPDQQVADHRQPQHTGDDRLVRVVLPPEVSHEGTSQGEVSDGGGPTQ